MWRQCSGSEGLPSLSTWPLPPALPSWQLLCSPFHQGFPDGKWLCLKSVFVWVLFSRYSVFPGDCAEGFWCKSGARVRNPRDGESGLPCPAGHYCPEGRGASEQRFPSFLEILGAISSPCCHRSPQVPQCHCSALLARGQAGRAGGTCRSASPVLGDISAMAQGRGHPRASAALGEWQKDPISMPCWEQGWSPRGF